MVRLSDIDLPVIFKDRLLFSSGIHNSLSILQEEIEKSLNLTNWEDQRTRSLFFAHSARDAQKWVGRVNNPHIINGQLFGDLEIHDADLALKLTYGKAPIGVSAEIRWPPQYNDPIDFTYRGFAMVPNPELPDTMINFSEQKKDDFKTAVVYVGDQSAKADFSDEKNEEVVEEEIKNEETAEFSVMTSETARGSPIEEVIEEKKEESNLMSAERGLNDKKMEENANNVVQEEVVEEVKTEEVKVEETKTEEVETEVEEVEEESKEDAKADFTKLNDKIEALEARVIALESGKADFSEEVETEQVETKEEEKVEEEAKEEEVEEVEEESKEETETEDAEADFSELTEGIKKLTEVLMKKEAAPMSTAEFASGKIDKGNAVIDRLTEALSK
jgi:hypothetical protein